MRPGRRRQRSRGREVPPEPLVVARCRKLLEAGAPVTALAECFRVGEGRDAMIVRAATLAAARKQPDLLEGVPL